jgi:signal transduction histidine kinase
MSSSSHRKSLDVVTVLMRFLPIAAGVIGLLGGASSMIGWIADIPRLIDWDLDGITIKFNPSLAITAIGTGVLIRAFYPSYSWVIRILGSIALFIGAATLFEHLTGLDLGIDTLFFDEAPNAPATSAPGRMGIPASSVLTCLGSALILITYRSRQQVASALSLLALAVTMLSLVGYLFGASALYSISGLTGIALQTATILCALALGMLALANGTGIMSILLRDDLGGSLFRRLIFPVFAISIGLGFLRVFAQNSGFVDTASGTAVRTVIEMVLLVALLWWTAESLSRSEVRSRDAARSKEENETHRRISRAQEAERRRIARDVHDHIGQQVTALRLRLESLCRRKGLETGLRSDLQNLCEQASKLDSDLSLLVWQMRPSILDSHGLASALNSFVREWSRTNGIDAEFQCPDAEGRLSSEIETNLYRIIQEALNNVLKHASAKRVSITMNYIADEAVVVIEDNGSGFDPESEDIHTTESSGFGLVGMKERAALVGGRLEIESSPGSGTVIMVRVPRDLRTANAARGASG